MRNNIAEFSKEEKDLYYLQVSLDGKGSHPLLTEVIELLGNAREKLGEYIEGRKSNGEVFVGDMICSSSTIDSMYLVKDFEEDGNPIVCLIQSSGGIGEPHPWRGGSYMIFKSFTA